MLRLAFVALCLSVSVAAQSAKEATEARITYIIQEQIPLGDRAAEDGKIPKAWWDEMKTTVMPASYAAARKFATLVDAWLAMLDMEYEAKRNEGKPLNAAITNFYEVYILALQHATAHREYARLHVEVHKRHSIEVSDAWHQERKKYYEMETAAIEAHAAVDAIIKNAMAGKSDPDGELANRATFAIEVFAHRLEQVAAGIVPLQERVESNVKKGL